MPSYKKILFVSLLLAWSALAVQPVPQPVPKPIQFPVPVPPPPLGSSHSDAGGARPIVDLKGLSGTALRAVKGASDMGVCSPELYEAGKFVSDLIFHEADERYRRGDPSAVWGSNQGVANFFRKMALDSPDLSADKEKLKTRILELDKKTPAKPGMHGPSLDQPSAYDAYREALAVTGGNVFRAATLIGMLGHDDITNIPHTSNLFARNSIGVALDSKVVERFKQAGDKCLEQFPEEKEKKGGRLCAGAGSTFNYHVNFGFYLGCQFAKRGFKEATITKVFADATALKIDDPFINADLKCRKTTGRFIQSYCIDLCTDIPKMLGYFYKKTTMANWLSDDARQLYDKGYRVPLLAEQKKFAKPEGWDDARFKKAAANLDYRLVHLEYGSEQSRTGAAAGAKACGDYKHKVTPEKLSKDAAELFERGNHNPSLAVDKLPRVPPRLARDAAKANTAWEELRKRLREFPERLDYADGIGEPGDPDKRIRHLTTLLGDRDIGIGYIGHPFGPGQSISPEGPIAPDPEDTSVKIPGLPSDAETIAQPGDLPTPPEQSETIESSDPINKKAALQFEAQVKLVPPKAWIDHLQKRYATREITTPAHLAEANELGHLLTQAVKVHSGLVADLVKLARETKSDFLKLAIAVALERKPELKPILPALTRDLIGLLTKESEDLVRMSTWNVNAMIRKMDKKDRATFLEPLLEAHTKTAKANKLLVLNLLNSLFADDPKVDALNTAALAGDDEGGQLVALRAIARKKAAPKTPGTRLVDIITKAKSNEVSSLAAMAYLRAEEAAAGEKILGLIDAVKEEPRRAALLGALSSLREKATPKIRQALLAGYQKEKDGRLKHAYFHALSETSANDPKIADAIWQEFTKASDEQKQAYNLVPFKSQLEKKLPELLDLAKKTKASELRMALLGFTIPVVGSQQMEKLVTFYGELIDAEKKGSSSLDSTVRGALGALGSEPKLREKLRPKLEDLMKRLRATDKDDPHAREIEIMLKAYDSPPKNVGVPA